MTGHRGRKDGQDTSKDVCPVLSLRCPVCPFVVLPLSLRCPSVVPCLGRVEVGAARRAEEGPMNRGSFQLSPTRVMRTPMFR